jgi:hypothetical protein
MICRLSVCFWFSCPHRPKRLRSSACQLGGPPIWGCGAVEARGIYGKEISPRSFATCATTELAAVTILHTAAASAFPP